MGYFPSVPCYDVILLNYPTLTPVLLSGSHLDRQWFLRLTNYHRLLLICGIGLLYTQPCPGKKNLYL